MGKMRLSNAERETSYKEILCSLAAKYRLKSNADGRVVSGHWKLAVRRRKSDQWRIGMMDVFCPVVEWETFRSIDLIFDTGATAAASTAKCVQYL